MYDKVFVALVGALCGTGGFVAGALVRQPEINKLQKQVACLQADVEELKQVAAEQNDEIKQMLLNYRALGVFAFQQKKELKSEIQDELICQYASNDYLTLLIDVVSTGRKLDSDEIKFYKQYGKMLEDNIIDQRELEELRPLMMDKHGHEINAMRECDLQSTFDRIEQYNEEKAENRKGHGFFRLKK